MASPLATAAEWLKAAPYIIITAGAGMSVDSGLPDFRGPEGFWRAYPLFKTLGKRFEEMSNPEWFKVNPNLAWGFFGHRLQLYNSTVPHSGYTLLHSWEKDLAKKMFVFTSNVDGAFEKAGFDAAKIVECHGAGTRLQCTNWRCTAKYGPYPTPADLGIHVNMETVECPTEEMPKCPNCGALARPNILMFDDGDCDMRVVTAQEERYDAFIAEIAQTFPQPDADSGAAVPPSFVVIEFGAGTFVTTIRRTSESLVQTSRGAGRLIRVNLREADVPAELAERGLAVGLSLGAKACVEQLDALLRQQ